MTPYLFVYGTLLPEDTGRQGLHERMQLAREATYVGAATTPGLLLDLGDYPGLADGDGLVRGGVYRLRDPEVTFAWLDSYEGVSGSPQDEYVRCVRPITLATGAISSCWMYVFMQSKAGLALIESGHWCLRNSRPAAF